MFWELGSIFWSHCSIVLFSYAVPTIVPFFQLVQFVSNGYWMPFSLRSELGYTHGLTVCQVNCHTQTGRFVLTREMEQCGPSIVAVQFYLKSSHDTYF